MDVKSDSCPRVFITGLNEDGKSIFVQEGPPKLLLSTHPEGYMGELWKIDSLPRTNQDGFQPDTYSLEPQGTGGVCFRIISMPPREAGEPDSVYQTESGMHQTDSIDFITIVEGEIIASLDSGEERLLCKGDSMVQRGTNHIWVNRADKPCVFSVVMVKPAILTLS